MSASNNSEHQKSALSRVFQQPRLEAELLKPTYRPQTIQLGANTDPYQPIERTRRITREILDVLSRFKHPVGVTTKSDLVTRDIDLLAPMADKNLAAVGISITSLDRTLARTLEPRCPRPDKRLNAVRQLTDAGIPVAVMVAPVIPGLNDHEIEAILTEARAAGAIAAEYIMLRLPLEIHALFEEWLKNHAPDRAKKVMRLIRETRGGKVYDSDYSQRMSGTGIYADLIKTRFQKARSRTGFNHNRASGFAQRTDLFVRPLGTLDQPSLFEF